MNATKRPTRAEIEAINDGLKAVGLTGPELGKAMGEIMKRLGPAAAKEEQQRSPTWLGHCSGCTDPHSEGTHQMGTIEHPNPPATGIDDQVKKLQAFKDYVHQRLDEAGIPTHPPGEHMDAGCRVGQRLDIALATTGKVDWDAIKAEIEKAAVDYSAEPFGDGDVTFNKDRHDQFISVMAYVIESTNILHQSPRTSQPTTGIDVEGVMELVREMPHFKLMYKPGTHGAGVMVEEMNDLRKALEAHAADMLRCESCEGMFREDAVAYDAGENPICAKCWRAIGPAMAQDAKDAENRDDNLRKGGSSGDDGLLPCPFCGGSAKQVETGPQQFCIECDGCQASSRVVYFLMDDGSMLLREAWNNRCGNIRTGPWISVEDRLPEPGVTVLVWDPRDDDHHEPGALFDVIDPDGDGTTWIEHSNARERFETACIEVPCIGPPAEAPYTHWMPLPAPPDNTDKG